MGLPSEVLVMVLARVPLLELANVRMVSRWEWPGSTSRGEFPRSFGTRDKCPNLLLPLFSSSPLLSLSTAGVPEAQAAGGWPQRPEALVSCLSGGAASWFQAPATD